MTDAKTKPPPGAFNPAINRAVSRWNETMTGMRQEYEAATENRFLERPKGAHSFGSGADYNFRDETRYFYLLNVARHIEENDPVVPQGVKRAVANIVQGGFKYRPETGEDRISRLLRERWEEYSDDENALGVDYDQEHNWHEFENVVATRMIIDGDLLLVPMNTGQLQLLESHRMRTPSFVRRIGQPRATPPNIRIGVELSSQSSRRRLRYWVTKHEFDGFGHFRFRPDAMRSISARDAENELNAFHIYHSARFSGTRGVTAIAPVGNTVGMHADIHFAKLVQQQVASFLGFIHEVPMNIQDYEAPEPVGTGIDPATGNTRNYGPDLSPGSEYWPHYAGEKITPFTSNIPNPEWFDQAKLTLTFISINLGLPLILFLLDASETNFSGWRGALEQAKLGFKAFQRHLCAKLHKRVLRFQQRRWIVQDRGFRSAAASMGADFWRNEWGFPRWPYVEPLKDVEADAMEIAAALNSPTRVHERKNQRWEEVSDEICRDTGRHIRCAMQTAQSLNDEFSDYLVDNPGERVRWREIAYPQTRRSAQMQIIDPETTASQSVERPEPAER